MSVTQVSIYRVLNLLKSMYIKRRGASLTLSIALQLGEAVIRTASTVDVDTGELQVEESAVFVKGRVSGKEYGVKDIQVAVWRVAFPHHHGLSCVQFWQ
jgi:hypothetical protein